MPLGKGTHGRVVWPRHRLTADRVKGGKPLRHAPQPWVESKGPPGFHQAALVILFRVSPLRCFPCYQYSTGNSPKASKLFPGLFGRFLSPPLVFGYVFPHQLFRALIGQQGVQGGVVVVENI